MKKLFLCFFIFLSVSAFGQQRSYVVVGPIDLKPKPLSAQAKKNLAEGLQKALVRAKMRNVLKVTDILSGDAVCKAVFTRGAFLGNGAQNAALIVPEQCLSGLEKNETEETSEQIFEVPFSASVLRVFRQAKDGEVKYVSVMSGRVGRIGVTEQKFKNGNAVRLVFERPWPEMARLDGLEVLFFNNPFQAGTQSLPWAVKHEGARLYFNAEFGGKLHTDGVPGRESEFWLDKGALGLRGEPLILVDKDSRVRAVGFQASNNDLRGFISGQKRDHVLMRLYSAQ